MMNGRRTSHLLSVLVFLFAGLLSVSLVPGAAQGQDRPKEETFLGTWMGTGKIADFQFRVFFHIEREEGELKATMDMPARKFTGLLFSVSTKGDSLVMEATWGSDWSYEGTLASEGGAIEGTYNGDALPLSKTTAPMRSNRLEDHFEKPLRGVRTGEEPRQDLFPIRETGISTEPVVRAAETFLERLTPEQREKTTFPIDAGEWRHWSNSPFLERRGTTLREMSEAQREAAFDLIRAGLSARGFNLARDIMRVDGYVSRLTENRERFGELLYHVTVMGEPSSTEPWGFQLDGHHMAVNFFVLGDQVVVTPRFFGSEPTAIDTGRHAGTEVLQEEQDQGLALVRSLSQDQREQAIIETKKTEEKMRTGPFRDNLTLDYMGISAEELSSEQHKRLLALIRLYVGNIREGHAEIRMEEVREHLEETYFAWIGDPSDDAVYYYRIHSPVLLIEFDHALRRELPGDPGLTRDHIHTVVRTPNGGDYGKDLLRQHYEAHKNDSDHQHHR